MRIKYYIDILLGLPKSIIINFKYLQFKQAIKLPILLSKDVIIKKMSGKISLGKEEFGVVKIGFGDIGIFDKKRSKSILKIEGSIEFCGNADIGHGSKINVNKNAKLILGNNFKISAESEIICSKSISIGHDCLMSWNCLVMDTDFHKIIDNDGNIINYDEEIIIGNNVWIACRNTILKGVNIKSNNIIAANSTICRNISGENQIIGGNDCRILKENVFWKY